MAGVYSKGLRGGDVVGEVKEQMAAKTATLATLGGEWLTSLASLRFQGFFNH